MKNELQDMLNRSDVSTLGSIDSLHAVRLVNMIKKKYDVDVPMNLIFNNQISLQDVTAFIINKKPIVRASQERIDWIQESQLDESITVPPQTNIDEGEMLELSNKEHVLLTGCTGFLGAFLLHRLLLATPANCTIHCLVRAANQEAGLERIIQVMSSFRLWNDIYRARIRAIVGSLSLPMLGLSDDEYQYLASNVQVIYHNAAIVNSVMSYQQLKNDNVDGTLHLIRLATTRGIKPFHYISTIGVAQGFHNRVYEVDCNEDDLSLCARLDRIGGYAQSKWVAERLVHQARERGLPVTIHRPGMIGGDTVNGCCNLSDWVTRFIRGCMVMSAYPDTNKRTLAMIPVDTVADIIMYLSQSPRSLRTYCYHLVNSDGNDIKFDCIMQHVSLSKEMRYLPFDEWYRELKSKVDQLEEQRSAQYDALWPMIALFNKGFYSTGGSFDNAETTRALEGNISLPPLTTDLITRYVDFLNNHHVSNIQ
jgi:thioester reductase-like protein